MSVAEQVIKEMQQLEGKKAKAIEELLAQRQQIDEQLAMLGHGATTGAKRGRKPGSKNKQPTTSKQATKTTASKKAAG